MALFVQVKVVGHIYRYYRTGMWNIHKVDIRTKRSHKCVNTMKLTSSTDNSFSTNNDIFAVISIFVDKMSFFKFSRSRILMRYRSNQSHYEEMGQCFYEELYNVVVKCSNRNVKKINSLTSMYLNKRSDHNMSAGKWIAPLVNCSCIVMQYVHDTGKYTTLQLSSKRNGKSHI